MKSHHDHPADAACTPECPAWADGALQLHALQRRFGDMLEACRAAVAIEYLYVSPTTQGAVLPEYLQQEEVVRLNLVAGRDTPEVLLDEWGVRCNLTFRGRRFDCAFPWPSILGGVLRPPPRRRARFGVIHGAGPALEALPGDAGGSGPGEQPRAAPTTRLGLIRGGKTDE